jgi:dCTP deaminase
MTLLRHESLRAAVREPELKRRLVVMPLLEERIGPATIDLSLGTEFIEVVRREEKILDPLNAPPDESIHETRISVPIGESVVLHPGHFIHGATLEFIRMPPHLGGQLLGRSSWARLRLIVATAVLFNPALPVR